MKRIFLGIIFVIIFIIGCAGGAKTTVNSTENNDILTLDQALKEAALRIDERIVGGSKIAPLNFNSPHDKFSDYVLDELTANLVDSNKLTVVDRKEVDLIRKEFDFQFSGEVGDDSMQELGRMLGAQSIISGSLTDLGDFNRIVIRVLNVQTASVIVQYRANIAKDNIVNALLTGGRTSVITTTPKQKSSGIQTVQDTTPQISQPQPKVENSFPRIGRWKLNGRSKENWIADLVIEEINNERFSGFFDWYYSPGIRHLGKEYFRGIYNVQLKTIVMEGYRADP